MNDDNLFFFSSFEYISADPNFSAPIMNITVPVSREAILTCMVHDLVSYKVYSFIYIQ